MIRKLAREAVIFALIGILVAIIGSFVALIQKSSYAEAFCGSDHRCVSDMAVSLLSALGLSQEIWPFKRMLSFFCKTIQGLHLGEALEPSPYFEMNASV
jgi:hypothetical protein